MTRTLPVRLRPLHLLLGLAAVPVLALLAAEGAATHYAPTAVATFLSGALCVAALAVPRGWLVPAGGLAVVASFTVSVVSMNISHRPEVTFGAAELCAVLLLITRVTRFEPPLWALALGGGAALDTALLPLRLKPSEFDVVTNVMEPVLVIAVALTVVLGLYLRVLDRLRDRAGEAERQAQRLEYARELHDFVAHHVTAIIAQTKAIRFATTAGHAPGPDQLDRMLEGIEQAGAQAMDSMRGMVSVLRGSGPAQPAARHPGDDLGRRLRALAETFSRTGPSPELTVDPRLAGRPLPPELTTTVHRLVQESLTNVRKHATGARRVTVEVRLRDDDPELLEVAVRDDGRAGGAGAAPAGAAAGADAGRRPGGYGLTGLSERVEAAGGTLGAGPLEGSGWQVLAVLPLSGTRPAHGAGLPSWSA